jgi:outer membrane protein assembly factor BamD
MRYLTVTILALLIIGLTGCSRYQKVLKSDNLDLKYNSALEYFAKGHYYKALPLLEEVVPVFRGTHKGAKAYYYYTYTHYYLDDYLMAAYHFENFERSYPTSPYAPECLYMSAYCYYLNSPVYSLDQTNTYKAIRQFQLFVNKYPNSERVAQSNELIDQLRLKLATKAFDNARSYYNRTDYKAAVVAFRNVLKDFPATEYKEEILFLITKSYYLYAQNSIESRKEERYLLAQEAFRELRETYPNSRYLREAASFYENSAKQITRLNY